MFVQAAEEAEATQRAFGSLAMVVTILLDTTISENWSLPMN